MDEITTSDEMSYARVVNKKGKTMAESGNINDIAQIPLVIFTRDITLDNEIIGVLTLGMNTEKITQRINSKHYTQLKREVIVILIIAFVEFLALSYAIIRPVKLMSESLVNNIDDKGIIKDELPVMSNDEFGILANQFNLLRNQLNQANERLQFKIELADKELHKTNQNLQEQSNELQKINEELKRLSFTDVLTGMYNRRHFEDLMKTEVEMSLRHGDDNSLILIDIDFFKKINDNYGHDAGDIILREVANTMKSELRNTDILCRVGGEEFIVLCKRANSKDAMDIAEKLRARVEKQRHIFQGKSINVTISLGVSSIPDIEKTITTTEFYKYSDLALYASKKTGRNKVTHYNDIRGQNTSYET
jgi:diguanylate cyclase (GGDEF)-like protein